MGQAIQAQCKKSNIKALDFQAKGIDLNSLSAVIDFSSPEGFIVSVNFCLKNKLPLISGTTGLKEEHLKLVKIAKKSIPILIAANMSIGIAGLKKSIQEYVLSTSVSSNCKIIEIHHTKKKDSPSGTALEIVKFLENYHADKIDGLIDVESYRIGNIFGIHRIEFKTEEGITYFQHIASSRDIFAIGALKAARSINSMEIGEYSFTDFLSKKL